MRQAALLVAVVCLLFAPLASAAGTGGGPHAVAGESQPQAWATQPQVWESQPSEQGDSLTPSVQEESLTTEGVHIAVQLQPDGDAHWNISATYELDSENDSAAFDRLVEAFKNRETDNGFSVDVFRSVAPDVSERVGRPMQITGEERTATRIDHGNNSTGVLSLQFTWTNFSQVNNESLVVDSFSGTWFGDLKPDQTLTIRPPAGYGTDTVQPNTNVVNGAYRWNGPQEFDAGEPSLVFTGSPSGPTGGLPLMAILGAAGLVLVGGALAWAYSRGKLPDVDVPDGVGAPDDGSEPDASSEPGDAGSGESAGGAFAETPAESSGGAGSAANDAGAAAAGAGGTATANEGDVDPDLLSDEERVERLLEHNGGRMKQSKIVEETRWSTAKVSQLLSSMDDEGRIEKLRIGRENLISLPGEGVNDE